MAVAAGHGAHEPGPAGGERGRLGAGPGFERQPRSLREIHGGSLARRRPVALPARATLRLTRVAALFYSLIESAKLCGVEPRAYLGEATRRAIRNAGTVTLPRNLK